MRLFSLVALSGAVLAAASPGSVVLESRGCKVMPTKPDPEVRDQIYQVALDMGVNDKVMLSMMATAIVESLVNNLDCGDKDSVGVFQQRQSQGWGENWQLMNVTYSTRAYLRVCIQQDKLHPNVDAGTLSQLVQVAEAGNKYTAQLGRAREYLKLAEQSVGRPGPRPTSSSSTRPSSPSRPTSTASHSSSGGSKPPSSSAPAPSPTTHKPPTPTTHKLPGPSTYVLYDQHAEPLTAVLRPSALVGRVDVVADAAPTPKATDKNKKPKVNLGPCVRAEYPRVGDSCMSFADRYGVKVGTLRELNEDIDSECLNLTVTQAWCVAAAEDS